jgi:RNA helicase HrpA
MNYLELPVYQHKKVILEALLNNQVIVVESPTGSGKTTQLPIILHEAGYSVRTMIGVTQPRRIAAVSVSEYIARQMGTECSGLVGYKMRFEDKTDNQTKIKIMTDGILLQEMKLDPWLSHYSCIIVDEAHERSLNIDFILGLLKRILAEREDFKVIVSSATINAQVFSAYFGTCPIVHIEAKIYPISLIYDPIPPLPLPNPWEFNARDERRRAGLEEELLIEKVCHIVERIIHEGRRGDILIFLSGEYIIKQCILALLNLSCSQDLYILPLYGRLSKKEQERIFEVAPKGKTKIIVSTNIAETSVTIDGITSVIDSGLSKLNYYDPSTFTSRLVESEISKASANQRKGRAGRTQEGNCYRLYERKDFEKRPDFTTEEIYRTDLSEVVLRMSDLGILDFENFDFIAPPNKKWLVGAIETLNILGALNPDRTLSRIGKMMTEFPLSPRHSRIIVEAIINYPDVIQESIIVSAFLSVSSPYILPIGEEMLARHAHHHFHTALGDFFSYLNLFHAYQQSPHKGEFCKTYYLDERIMAEIHNIVIQLEQVVFSLGVPIGKGGTPHDYLCAISRALVQFICVQTKHDRADDDHCYHSTRVGAIYIHPGSSMFQENPQIIVAGEIVETSRRFAMSVSPIPKDIIEEVYPELISIFFPPSQRSKRRKNQPKKKKKQVNKVMTVEDLQFVVERTYTIGSTVFNLDSDGTVLLPWVILKKMKPALGSYIGKYKDKKGTVTFGEYTLLIDEPLDNIFLAVPHFGDLEEALNTARLKQKRYPVDEHISALVQQFPTILKAKPKSQHTKILDFIALQRDKQGNYWLTTARKFSRALKISLVNMEILIEELANVTIDDDTKHIIDQTYRRLFDISRQ